MNTSLIVLLLFAVNAVLCGVSDFVNPFIGSGGEGYGTGTLPPGVQIPFGLVRLSPDTSTVDNVVVPWTHYGGYHYQDDHIRAFTHTHLVGAGVADFGNIGVMVMNRRPEARDVQNSNYYSNFSHVNETSKPGYYSVYLETPNAQAELSATHHVGAHRYTFLPPQQQAFVLFDVSMALKDDGCKDSFVEIELKNQEVRGWIWNSGSLSSHYGGVHVYFVAKFDRRFITFGTWKDLHVRIEPSANGTHVGAFVEFDVSQDHDVEIFVGISLISLDQARANLEAETKGKNFNAVRKETQDIWEDSLSVIQVKVEDNSEYYQDQLVKFYSALYRTMLAPTAYTEQGGWYIGFDQQLHNVNETKIGPTNFYSDMSIWDTFRTEYPWLVLMKPDVMTDMIKSMLIVYQVAGFLPKWPLAFGETDCMIGTHAQVVIADAYFKGVRDFDLELAYQGMYQGATQPQQHAGRTDLEHWTTIGYVTSEASNRGTSETLEYAYDDWCVARIAQVLGYNSDAEMFFNRSKNYKNAWNSQHQIFCPRSSLNEWDCPVVWDDVFDPRYVEGDAWHWRWFVPHDVPGLIELFGSEDNFLNELTFFFEESKNHRTNFMPDPYFWAGNEHDIFAPYMFSWVGRNDLTQEYARWNLENRHTTGPDGLPGNDDYGTMSAWVTFNMLGFYPLAGSDLYVLSSPVFPQVSIQLPTGGTLNVITHNASQANVVAYKVLLNGQEMDLSSSPFLLHDQIAAKSGENVTLEFFMTSL